MQTRLRYCQPVYHLNRYWICPNHFLFHCCIPYQGSNHNAHSKETKALNLSGLFHHPWLNCLRIYLGESHLKIFLSCCLLEAPHRSHLHQTSELHETHQFLVQTCLQVTNPVAELLLISSINSASKSASPSLRLIPSPPNNHFSVFYEFSKTIGRRDCINFKCTAGHKLFVDVYPINEVDCS